MDFRKLTLRTRLGVTFGGLAVLVIAVAALALTDLRSANERFDQFVTDVNARAQVAARIREAVDERAIAARNLVLVASDADRAAELEQVRRAHGEVGRQVAQLQQMAREAGVPADVQGLVDAIVHVESKYGPVALGIVDLAARGQRDDAIVRMDRDCRPLLAALVKATSAYRQQTDERSRAMVAEAAQRYAEQRTLLLLACLFAVTVAVVAGWLITRSVGRALGAEPAVLGGVAQRVADGDLSPLEGVEQAPAGSVLASLAAMQAGLSRVVRQVRQAADSIATGTSEIAEGNANLSERTEEQASALQQTAATMDEFQSAVTSNADNAQQANQLAAAASQVAAQGGEAVGDVVATMRGIDESSKRIADIIGVIDGIAFQTNILALNAAVEAARAGEQGRGFAVVAGEVRLLAKRSADAAKEVRQLILASVEHVGQGTQLADRAGKTMQDVVASIRRVSDIVGEISTASAEQSNGVTQIGQAVSLMDEATQQNAALVEESAVAADSLRLQAQQLVDVVATFRLDEQAQVAAPQVAVKAVRAAPAPKAAAPVRAAAPRPAPPVPVPRRAPALVAAGDSEWASF